MKLSSTLKRSALLALAALFCAAGASAQMYKWTDANGVVHFSDQPPGDDAKVETKSYAGGGSDVALPYELADAVRKHPVTLYTMADCNACDQGRAMLKQRGIPFAEKTVSSQDDFQKLTEAGGGSQLPFLVVGGARKVGFEAGAWNDTLNNAAYPAQRMLPSNYQYPAAVSAAPARPLAREVVREAAPERPAPKPKAPPPSDKPPGFRF